jgi:hypothetical protein
VAFIFGSKLAFIVFMFPHSPFDVIGYPGVKNSAGEIGNDINEKLIIASTHDTT